MAVWETRGVFCLMAERRFRACERRGVSPPSRTPLQLTTIKSRQASQRAATPARRCAGARWTFVSAERNATMPGLTPFRDPSGVFPSNCNASSSRILPNQLIPVDFRHYGPKITMALTRRGTKPHVARLHHHLQHSPDESHGLCGSFSGGAWCGSGVRIVRGHDHAHLLDSPARHGKTRIVSTHHGTAGETGRHGIHLTALSFSAAWLSLCGGAD